MKINKHKFSVKKIFVAMLSAALLLSAVAGITTIAPETAKAEIDLRGVMDWPQGPSMSCRSAFLYNCNSGEVLFSQNADETRYPASVTKVMTALLVCENCDLSEQVTFSHAAVTDLEEGGFTAGFKEGEVLTVEQCLYALLLSSVNECAYALAEHVAGSISAFADMMNARAAQIGCTNTNFVNPHGLNNPDHKTTAHDMGLILATAIQNETFLRIDSTTSYRIEPTELNPDGFNCSMGNQLINSGAAEYYDGAVAGKTGYTSLALFTLVTYAERNGVKLVAVSMKGSSRADTYSDTRKMFDYGFNNFTLTDLSQSVQNFAYGINAASALPLKLDGGLCAYLPSSLGSLTFNFTDRGSWDADGVVGKFAISSNGESLASSTLSINSEILPKTEEGSDANVQDPADIKTETEGGTSVGLVILYIFIGLIVCFGIYYAIIQYLRYKRRKRKAEMLRRRRRMQRIKAIRTGEAPGEASDKLDDDL